MVIAVPHGPVSAVGLGVGRAHGFDTGAAPNAVAYVAVQSMKVVGAVYALDFGRA